MSNVRHHQEAIQKQVAPGDNSQLEQLRIALKKRLDEVTQTGHVEQINLVQKAIYQLDASQKNQPQTQTKELSQSQAQSAQAREAIQAVNPLTQQESLAIKAMRSIPTKPLPTGRVFASISGREPSNTSYMKTNIKGLFDLVATKNS